MPKFEKNDDKDNADPQALLSSLEKREKTVAANRRKKVEARRKMEDAMAAAEESRAGLGGT